MIKISYYNDITENILSENNAEEISFYELIEELYYLESDNTSYITVLTKNNKFKVISNEYDSYLVLEFDNQIQNFKKIKVFDFEELKLFMHKNTNPDSTYDDIDSIPAEESINKEKDTNKIQNNLKKEDPKRFSLLD